MSLTVSLPYVLNILQFAFPAESVNFVLFLRMQISIWRDYLCDSLSGSESSGETRAAAFISRAKNF